MDPSRAPGPTETSSHTEDSRKDDLEFFLEGELPPLIPAVEYPIVFSKAQRRRPFGRPVLILWFKVLPDGSATTELTAGLELPYHCPVPPTGRFAPSSNYARAWAIAARRRPTRRDRMSIAVFRHRLLLAKVRTVTKDPHQQPLPPANHYSVIDRIIDVASENR